PAVSRSEDRPLQDRGGGVKPPLQGTDLVAQRWLRWLPLAESLGVCARISIDDGHFGVVGGGLVGDAEDQEGAVVVRSGGVAAELVGRSENLGGESFRRIEGGSSGEHGFEAFRAEGFVGGVLGLEDAVGSEEQPVARTEFDGDFVVVRFGKKAEG